MSSGKACLKFAVCQLLSNVFKQILGNTPQFFNKHVHIITSIRTSVDWKVHNYTGLELGNSFLGMKYSHVHHPFGLSLEGGFGERK